MKLDMLAFGAHADDVEIGMAGTISKYTQQGYKVGICDLTEAELSSNGTVERRKQEATNAGNLLRLSTRRNLALPDRGLMVCPEQIQKVVSIIRETKPQVIFSPYYKDRHPDHGMCSQIVREAVFNAGILKYKDEKGLPAHKVKDHYFYFINGFHPATFVVDISSFIEQKKQVLSAYESQFIKESTSVTTPLTEGYVQRVISRESVYGQQVGVSFAEGFIAEKPLRMSNLLGD
jgi:N-acetylglucosamine malate deacetylase 1